MLRKDKFKKKEGLNLPRINNQIKANQVRLVMDQEGVKIVPIAEALRIAEEMGLDLVEVSANQDPPVCKIMDFGKWKFEQQKKKKIQLKNQHVIEIKELKFTPQIGAHDYQIKLKKALEFLEDGNKVRITMKFKGRQISHPEIGMEIVNRFITDTQEKANIELEPKIDGKQIVAVLTPKSKK
ncbi:MAG: translation initiation factor IF-3 [Leptonema sp. (in: bacteria)]